MLSPELVNLLEEHINLGLISTTDPIYAICSVNVLHSHYRSCSCCPFYTGDVCPSKRDEQYQDFVDYLQEHHPELYI